MTTYPEALPCPLCHKPPHQEAYPGPGYWLVGCMGGCFDGTLYGTGADYSGSDAKLTALTAWNDKVETYIEEHTPDNAKVLPAGRGARTRTYGEVEISLEQIYLDSNGTETYRGKCGDYQVLVEFNPRSSKATVFTPAGDEEQTTATNPFDAVAQILLP